MKPTVATLNYTSRQRIERKNVRISGGNVGGVDFFILEKLEIDEFGFEPNSLVVIECFTGKIGFARFVHGRLSELQGKNGYRHEFPGSDLANATFRVKVVSTLDPMKGRILADADNIPVEFGGKPPALLGIESADIGDLVWALEFVEDVGPILQINERILDPQQIARDNEFRAIVMPRIVEEIALWVATRVDQGELDPQTQKWKRALSLSGISFDSADTSSHESRSELAGLISRTFAKQHGFVDLFRVALERRQS